MIKATKESLLIVEEISKDIVTQHHYHFHILYDISRLFNGKIYYVEIGCYAGRSASLMLQRPNTDVVSIDIGKPIPKEIAINNIKKYNIHKNTYNYIEGKSQDDNTILKLKNILKDNKIDILFIDGSHLYQDVINDFILYEALVKNGGYIIFDDYYDFKYSPDVNKAVNFMVNNNFNNYEIIGTCKNELLAKPQEMKDNNCFIIKKIV